MDLFDKLSDTIVSAGKEVSQKAKGMTDVAKLQYEIKTKEDFVNTKYRELGEQYYMAHKDDEDLENEAFEEIEIALQRIQDIKEEIMDLKGAKACPKCGAKVAENASFCSVCGAKVNDMFEEE